MQEECWWFSIFPPVSSEPPPSLHTFLSDDYLRPPLLTSSASASSPQLMTPHFWSPPQAASAPSHSFPFSSDQLAQPRHHCALTFSGLLRGTEIRCWVTNLNFLLHIVHQLTADETGLSLAMREGNVLPYNTATDGREAGTAWPVRIPCALWLIMHPIRFQLIWSACCVITKVVLIFWVIIMC